MQAGQPGDDRVGDADRQHARVAGDAQGLEREHREAESGRAPGWRRPGTPEPQAGGERARARRRGSARRSHRAPPARASRGCGRRRPSRSAAAKRPASANRSAGTFASARVERGLDRWRDGFPQRGAPTGTGSVSRRATMPARWDRCTAARRPSISYSTQSEGVDVGRRPTAWIAHRLLGAHVRRRPQRQAGGGQRVGLGTRLHQLGDAEVGQQRVALAEQDVLRLHVPVHNPVPVGAVERVGDLARRWRGPRAREAAARAPCGPGGSRPPRRASCTTAAGRPARPRRRRCRGRAGCWDAAAVR